MKSGNIKQEQSFQNIRELGHVSVALGSHPVYNKMRVRTVSGSSRFYFLIYYTDASQTGWGMVGVGASNPGI